MQKNKYLILFISIICISISIAVIKIIVKQNEPINVISNSLRLDLPSSVNVIYFEYGNNGEWFNTKILIENKDIDLVKKKINDCFGGDASEITSVWGGYEATISSLWDLKNQKIEASYLKLIDETKWFVVKHTHEVWAFISKDKNGHYYLYISRA